MSTEDDSIDRLSPFLEQQDEEVINNTNPDDANITTPEHENLNEDENTETGSKTGFGNETGHVFDPEFDSSDPMDQDHSGEMFGEYSNENEDEDKEEVLKICREALSCTDFVMEPQVFAFLEKYFTAGGSPEQVVELLSFNYKGTPQLINLLAEWLVGTGAPVESVQSNIEQRLSELIHKHFMPAKADVIFHQQTEGQIDWLPELITHAPWRNLIYKLSKEYPDCLMLNFALKLISDAGYQNEICSVSTVAQQLEIFSKVLCTAITNVLVQEPESPAFQTHLQELAACSCHSEHSYLYTQALLQLLSSEQKTGPCLKRLSQELRLLAPASGDTTLLHLLLFNTVNAINPGIIQALQSMLSRNSLNPADITLLYTYYSSNEPPPVDLIRDPKLIDLLIDALFRPDSRLNPEHKPKYIYLLAYAASVSEMYKKGTRKYQNKDELKQTQQAIDKVHTICTGKIVHNELLAEIPSLFNAMRFAVVSLGILHWVKSTVSDPGYFKVISEPVPLHLALVDEIANLHPPLHAKALELLTFLFQMPLENLEVLVQLELRKMLIDRMVHLLSKGFALQVVRYMCERLQREDTDLSLIRYFVTEVSDIISPPYSAEFSAAFLPLVECIGDRESLSEERQAAIKEFVSQAK